MMLRISPEEGLEIFKSMPLEQLCFEAQKIRFQKNPRKEVTFVIDSNPNYTNVCTADCSFCAFYRSPNVKGAYTKSVDEVMEHLSFASQAGCSTVLLQGGLHPSLTLDYYVKLVEESKKRFPHLVPHFFSAPEIYNIAKVNGLGIEDVLKALFNAGQRSLPGGGAEILSEAVRSKISPKKMEEDGWIQVHEIAHQLGFKSTATMMYGHIETPEDIIIHLESLRTLQDKTHGFTAFIPWSYKRDRTALRRTVKHWAGENAYLRILAFARIYLDNFDHIQASWFSEGKLTGIKALSQCGCDDFGGILLEENVHKETGFIHHVTVNDVLYMIREAGFEPVERDAYYRRLRDYKNVEAVSIPEAQRPRIENKLTILQNAIS